MIVAVDSCFGLIRPHQHGKANKQTRVPTDESNNNSESHGIFKG